MIIDPAMLVTEIDLSAFGNCRNNDAVKKENEAWKS